MQVQEASPLPTFRDPAGSVELRSEVVLRHVRPEFAEQILQALQIPAVQGLVRKGKLIGSEIVGEDASGLTLAHPRIPFISYPWEWPAALLLSAAELTLDICSELIASGLILKDATPLNVLFAGSKPVFVDVGSLEPHVPGDAIWLAQAQFIRTFVLPLLANSRLGWPLSALLLRRDGFEPEDLYAALPWTKRLQRGVWSTVTLPSLVERATRNRHTSEVKTAQALAGRVRSPEIVRQLLLGRLKGLKSTVRRAARARESSVWTDYTTTAVHYSSEESDAKVQFVGRVLQQSRPGAVLDIGANTGVFSRMAAAAGASVVAVEADPPAAELLARRAQADGADILPLQIDISHPTPAVGWANRECLSFLQRAEGRFDLVLMLAVIHHLLLSSQIPLTHIAELAAQITRCHLVIEWVPPSDPMFQKLLRGRDAIYAHLTERAFREAFAEQFVVEGEQLLTNGRILFHMVKR